MESNAIPTPLSPKYRINTHTILKDVELAMMYINAVRSCLLHANNVTELADQNEFATTTRSSHANALLSIAIFPRVHMKRMRFPKTNITNAHAEDSHKESWQAERCNLLTNDVLVAPCAADISGQIAVWTMLVNWLGILVSVRNVENVATAMGPITIPTATIMP
jgi:hypothetical protein